MIKCGRTRVFSNFQYFPSEFITLLRCTRLVVIKNVQFSNSLETSIRRMKFQSIFGASNFEAEIQINYSLLVQLITAKHLEQTSLFYLLILQRQTDNRGLGFGCKKGVLENYVDFVWNKKIFKINLMLYLFIKIDFLKS